LAAWLALVALLALVWVWLGARAALAGSLRGALNRE
jgi:hypothetical protein